MCSSDLAVLWHVLEAVGEDAMLRLVERAGGTRIWIGRPPGEGHRLTEAVGQQAALKIHARLAAEHIKQIDVPVMAARLQKARRCRILAMRGERIKVADIARALGLTERGVWKALAKARDDAPDDRQLSLI